MPTPDDYIQCRTYGHSWYEYDDSNWTPLFGTPIVLRCERCSMTRRDTIDSLGQVAARSYMRPLDYSYAPGQMPSRSDFRLRIIARKLAEPKTKQRKRTTDVA